MLFALRFAPFYTAFCTILPCVLHQNAMRFAPYFTAFSTKTHFILLKTARKTVQMAFSWNKYPFYIIRRLTPFCIKPTFARIDFLRQGGRLMSKKGTHNVKFLTEKLTGLKVDKLTR